MPRKTSRGIRPPLSEETRESIALAVRAAAAKKRESIMQEKPQKEPTKPLIEIVKMEDQEFSPKLFQPMITGKKIDGFFSTKGGIPRATNYLIVGDPGVGKSTVAMDILSDLQNSGASVLFVCAEMTRIDLYDYVKRYPKFGTLPILFLGEYLDSPRSVVETALKKGYDCVLIDSLTEVVEAVRESESVSSSSAEKWIVDMMLRHNLGGNDMSINSTFLCIQQVTKGGVFVGGNKLKHNTTGMLELRFDEGGEKSYMMFSKNRRGCVGVKMGFNLKLSGDVGYEGPDVRPRVEQEERGEKKGNDAFDGYLRDLPEF